MPGLRHEQCSVSTDLEDLSGLPTSPAVYPKPSICGPAPEMSGQLGISHSERLPQRLIPHVQKDATPIRKFSLQPDLNPSSEETH